MMAPPPYGADLPMPNIDRYVAAILGQFYGEFPVKVDLDVRRLTGHTATNADGEICAPDGSVSEEAAVAYGTIEWLIETGYVRALEPRHGSGVRGCVLTEAGLRLLKATPDSVTTRESYGSTLARLVRDGALELATEVARGLVR